MAHILCVDDDAAIIELRKTVLKGAGHSITACYAVDDAVDELQRAEYDAVVMDWRFDGGSGQAIVEAAKSRPGLPVVVVSGYVGEAFRSAEPMADIYLEKPADATELLQVLKILLEVRAARLA